MSNGTTLNGLYAPRIHRSNATAVLDETQEDIKNAGERLLILAAMTPTNVDVGCGPFTWDRYIQGEITGLLDDLRSAWWRNMCAKYILDNPGDVVDDFDEFDKGETPAQ